MSRVLDVKKLAGDASAAFLSQGISLIVSVATSLLVPKILGVEGFGYWQLFLFYGSYMGFCNLGLNDGVYLLYGGVSRQESDKRSLNSQMWVGILFESAVALIVAIAAILGSSDDERAFVLIAVAFYIVVYNLFGYLGYMFQAFGETRLFSRSILVSRIAFAIPLAALLVLHITDFRFYVIGQLFAQAVALAWCIWKARDVLSAGLTTPMMAVREAASSIRVGVKLLLSNLASMFVLGVLRLAVDARWGIEEFGQLSLSLSLVGFALAFISQVGMVLFPALRKARDSELRSLFHTMRDIMALATPACYLLVLPSVWLLKLWLPAYADSLGYLMWLLPICVFDSQMSILGTTYLKVLRGEKQLLFINLITVFASVSGVVIGVWLLDSVLFAIGSSVFAIVLRSVTAELVVSKKIGATGGEVILLGEILVTASYVFINALLPEPMMLPAFVAVYAVFLVFFKDRIKRFRAKLGHLFESSQ
ncbi:lipopolysaccharide biosynthesis protein [Eggerthella guodeyinii]|uniref:Polysaccharide biosynthesis protein n=1 Tax=Eggerthella guodeyinii TaxID=2690837 RepID=A0A6N7RTG7_9ACTN|nr:hypothetical protein [Eggerthella guodeyinii]MRX84078.1 hypothetical protein [Eggerthella guodeyinii]